MAVLIRNTTGSIINIGDLALTIAPEETLNLSDVLISYNVSESNDILPKITTGNIVVNDGVNDLTISEAIRYITYQNIVIGPKDRGGRQRVHQTSRQDNTAVYWTGSGDDPEDLNDVGGGQSMSFNHISGDGLIHEIYADFNIVENETWIHEGYMMWHNESSTSIDTATVEVVPRVCSLAGGTNTNWTNYMGLLFPAAGNGVVQPSINILDPLEGVLIFIPKDDLNIQPPSYWNANYNSDTKLYEELEYAPMADGTFNIFTYEHKFSRFANRIPLIGNGFMQLQSSDVDQFGHGMRIKFTLSISAPDHNAQLGCFMTFNRSKSC